MIKIKANLIDKRGKLHKGKDLLSGNCVFPFKHSRKMQNNCVDGKTGKWCATKVKKNLSVDKWGYCVDKTISKKKTKKIKPKTSSKSKKVSKLNSANTVKSKKHTPTEIKYCSCLMKVRGNSLKGEKIGSPYAICTSSLYNKKDIKRLKKVKCSKYYQFDIYPLKYLQAYAIEKKVPYKTKSGKMYTKPVLLKHINKYVSKKKD